MSELIKKRDSFNDIDVINCAYIEYEPYDTIPSCEDFNYGETRKIVLRNKSTNELEEIEYTFSGGVPFYLSPGYNWFWGDITSRDLNCVLLFDFKLNGDIQKIAVVFCGKSLNADTFNKINEKIQYAAQITSFGPFGSMRDISEDLWDTNG